jgi:hypothetical protein
MVAVLEALEAPVVLDAQVAALNAELKDAKPDAKADIEKQIAELSKDLAAANQAQAAQTAALTQTGVALATRLQQYRSNVESLRGRIEELKILAGLKDLIRKETAIAAVQIGADLVAIHKKNQLWTGLPVLIVVLLGGFTTNFLWCLFLNIKNKTGYQYFCSKLRGESPTRESETIVETAIDAPSEEVVTHAPKSCCCCSGDTNRAPMLRNYFFSALAGTTWYFQFFFYTMGSTQMGKFDFASWTLHMASIIIFSTMWGWIFHEWKGSSKKAHGLIATGILALILSTIIIGVGTWLKGQAAGGH